MAFGSSQRSVTSPSPARAVRVGVWIGLTSEGLSGISTDTAADAEPAPVLLTARTKNVEVSPPIRPVTVCSAVSGPLLGIVCQSLHLTPSGFNRYCHFVMPASTGSASQRSVAWPVPACAVRPVGGGGGGISRIVVWSKSTEPPSMIRMPPQA